MENYETYQGKILQPGKTTTERIFRVVDVGEGVEDIKVGDAVVTKNAHQTVMGYFIDITNVLGVLRAKSKAADAA